MSYNTDSILGLIKRVNLNQNDRERLVLPYIQRDYVWPEEKILSLLDSISRGYPIGTVLLWETKRETKFREFQKYFPANSNFLNKANGIPCTMVLDGQQRIQSLFVTCYGSINSKEVFVNLLSGYQNAGSQIQEEEDSDNSETEPTINEKASTISYSDEIYEFKFLDDTVVEEINLNGELFVKLKDILFAQVNDIENYKDKIAAKYHLTSEQKSIASTNLMILREVFNRSDYFSYYTIDKQLLSDDSAKTISEVLEIFFRVNSTGTPLSKSELIFSLIKSKWIEAFETFEKITQQLNESDKFLFENDFIIKCLLTIHTNKSRFSVERLSDNVINKFMNEDNVKRFEKTMLNVKTFLTEKCLLRSDTIFSKSYNTFLPIIYFVYKHPNNIIPESEERKIRFFIYASLMKKYISRYTDNRVPRLLKEKFKDLAKNPNYFPLKESLSYLEKSEGTLDLDDDNLLNSNINLVMNIVYQGIILPPYQKSTHKDLDHIFPKSKLSTYKEEEVNFFPNYRYIDNIINKIKSDSDPWVYFKNMSDHTLLADHLVNKSLLSADQYSTFILDRKLRIITKVKEFLKYD